ncbi:ABC transporter substrate-binding protein [Reyranella aquatilis]|uniref:ABC transporter substrate-binding protein n=1 Tax=Reyranella aquatilis TaxID=2035356 RepID=A0ABS8KSK1_9HYPH|nr:ABC transporter substrate-binding protein [Reyranella aquatilis]MCC8429035.1 ABC transporter substrate-binding protein [Reyranella aquatilis]
MPLSSFQRRAFLAGGASLLAAPAVLAQGARVPIRIGNIPVIGAAPIFVVDKEGWARDAGLDLTLTTFQSGPHAIQALASGTLDAYVAGIAPLGVARSRGVDVKVVAATASGENVFVAVPRLAQHFAPGVAPAEAFKRYKAATGKPARLATQPAGSVPNTTLQYWLWEVIKANREDVEIVAMGIDATQQAVLADAVEGATVREPALTIIQKSNPGIKLVEVGDKLFPGQPGTVVAVTGALIAKQPAAVQALVDALVRAGDLLNRDPDKAAPAVAANLAKGIVDLEIIKTALKSPATRFVIDPREVIAPSKAMEAYQVKLGSLKEAAPLDDLFDVRFFEKARRPG